MSDKKIINNINFQAMFFALTGLIIGLLTIDNYIDFGGDSTQFLSQAVALVENTIGEHYKNYEFIMNNSVKPLGMLATSWCLPILLAIIYKFLGLNYYAFKIIMCFSLSSSIFLLYRELSRRTSLLISVIFTTFFLFCPWLINFQNAIRKDIPFLFFSFLSIIFFNKLIQNAQIREKIKISVISAILVFVCLLMKENGAVILLMFVFSQIFDFFKNKENRKTKAIIYTASTLLVIILYQIFSLILPIEYVMWLFDFKFFENLLYYIEEFSISMFGRFNYSIYFAILTLILLLFGVIKNFKKEIIFAIYLALILPTCLYSPADQGFRYILNFAPFILIFAALGIEAIKNKKIKYIIIISFLLVTILNIKISSEYIVNRIEYKDNSQTALSDMSIDIYNYIKKNTKETDKIIYVKPRILFFYTKRLSFKIGDNSKRLSEADYQLNCAGNNLLKYAYPSDNKYLFENKTYIEEAGIYLNPVYRNENYILYKIEKD